MLSKPKYGWTKFKLDGTSQYGLSYIDDIAFEWLDQSILSLENLRPFCVKGFLEPGRFLCVVSYWNCHIVIEDDGKYPLEMNDIRSEYSHTNMIEFCKYLHRDISSYIGEWVSFVDYYDGCDITEKKELLVQKLDKLEELIAENSEYFGENYCFL